MKITSICRYQLIFIDILFGSVLGILGKVIDTTPFVIEALICSELMSSPILNCLSYLIVIPFPQGK